MYRFWMQGTESAEYNQTNLQHRQKRKGYFRKILQFYENLRLNGYIQIQDLSASSRLREAPHALTTHFQFSLILSNLIIINSIGRYLFLLAREAVVFNFLKDCFSSGNNID